MRRKAEVVAAVSGGLLSVDEACERYSLTLEEFAEKTTSNAAQLFGIASG